MYKCLCKPCVEMNKDRKSGIRVASGKECFQEMETTGINNMKITIENTEFAKVNV